jgi:hypothetical protein
MATFDAANAATNRGRRPGRLPRYIEFFTANIRNANKPRAYARSCARSLTWCEGRGLTMSGIRPHDVGAIVNLIAAARSPERRDMCPSRYQGMRRWRRSVGPGASGLVGR